MLFIGKFRHLFFFFSSFLSHEEILVHCGNVSEQRENRAGGVISGWIGALFMELKENPSSDFYRKPLNTFQIQNGNFMRFCWN